MSKFNRFALKKKKNLRNQKKTFKLKKLNIKKCFLQKKSKFFTKHRYSNFFCFKKKNELKSFYFKKKKEKKASVSLYLDEFIKTNLNLKYSSIKINFNTKTTLTTKKYLFLHKNLLK